MKCAKLVLFWWLIENVHQNTLPVDGMEACISKITRCICYCDRAACEMYKAGSVVVVD